MPIDKKNIAACIDHTLLKAEASSEAVRKLCTEAKEYHFASVCINPWYVSLASQALAGSDVKVCTVIGFPLGAAETEVKAYEAAYAVCQGALEVDMVINLGMLKSGDYAGLENDVRSVVQSAKEPNPDAIVKVIIECCLLSTEEKEAVCKILLKTGAEYVKTSTGFSTGGATIEDVRLMKTIVGDKMKIKAAGGIRTYEDATAMLEAGADRIGTSNGVAIVLSPVCEA
ncbi:MAG: deoxyribose-phosphate aldolase [Spirochaetaceae bacterium]|jgi:deoxyribose-phosphate aldolase|nr:deoxyribose-phosphate aldolase [Spirochaetaceae bacterium]